MKSNFDISCENFDHFFASQIPNLTEDAKDGLPRDVLFKLFRKGGAFNSTSTSKLGILAKLYIFVKSLKKRWFLVIEDEEHGMKLSDFNDIRRMIKERDLSIERAKELVSAGGFVLGAKDLVDTYSYLNRLSTSKAYNYLVRAKNAPRNEVSEADKRDLYITQFIVNWEGRKKDIVSQTGMNMPEIYVLMALYHGNEASGATLYHEVYKRAYQSSPAKIKLAFGSLQHRGYLVKYGATKHAKMQITPLGKDVLRGIMSKYLLNW